jgi:hypothetical protein
MMEMDATSGLSQEVGSIRLAPPPGLAQAVASPIPEDADRVMNSTDRTIWLSSTFMQDLFESAILLHFEVVKAASAVVGDHIGLEPKELLTGWRPVLAALNGLAYNLAEQDPWCRLGILPHAGQKPSEFLIEQRFAVASTFLSASLSPSWTMADKDLANSALACLDSARMACLELLPEVLRARARDPRFSCPRWAELGHQALQMILHSAPCLDEVVATQLSDILGMKH